MERVWDAQNLQMAVAVENDSYRTGTQRGMLPLPKSGRTVSTRTLLSDLRLVQDSWLKPTGIQREWSLSDGLWNNKQGREMRRMDLEETAEWPAYRSEKKACCERKSMRWAAEVYGEWRAVTLCVWSSDLVCVVGHRWLGGEELGMRLLMQSGVKDVVQEAKMVKLCAGCSGNHGSFILVFVLNHM